MCFEPSARLPLPPIAGGAEVAGTAELVLEADDGNRFSAYSAAAFDTGAPWIVILPDVRGLHPFYRDLSERFAEAGVTRSRSTSSGAPPAWGDAGTTSTTWIT